MTGDWQKFKGIDGTEGTLRVAAPKTSKKDLYEAAIAAAGKSLELKGSATTVRRKPAKAEAAVAEITEALAEADKPAEAAAEGEEA
ncbi:MAG: 30S ribosomal protein S16 [bacterium ADurb.BinA028]|nr:MAG: 30S ribosomal protein S16 [bacterium ADurb.BinA028]